MLGVLAVHLFGLLTDAILRVPFMACAVALPFPWSKTPEWPHNIELDLRRGGCLPWRWVVVLVL